MPAHLLIKELAKDPYRFDFFAALRLFECANPQQPRLGVGVKAGDEPVRLAQEPELEFPPSALGRYVAQSASGKPRLAVNFFGLFGPNGPLPLHLTEYARERLRHHHDPTFARFADIFHHRMISLFYRAWANARPEVQYDRPESDRFGFYVGSLFGIAGATTRHRDALDDRAKLFYAGYFSAQTKHPSGLLAIIADLLGVSIRIEEFVGEWMALQTGDQSRLGFSAETSRLGQSLILGAAVWGCQHKFRIVLGPLARERYLSLLPGGVMLPQLIAIVRNYVGLELVWEAQLILKEAEVPAELALGQPRELDAKSLNGGARLGWSMWLGPRPAGRDADDLLLNPFIRSNAAK